MTAEDRAMLDKINAYADKVLGDIDPQKTRVSFQLQKLQPIMEEIAKEKGVEMEDIFIQYMDLASEAAVETERKFQSTVGNMTKYGDIDTSL
ncbi:MAG: hypothetical protein HDR22_05410 [Lachnospiraceae bacterium]|nr:hypothetical protein [Lachnospiraceae bacterium]